VAAVYEAMREEEETCIDNTKKTKKELMFFKLWPLTSPPSMHGIHPYL